MPGRCYGEAYCSTPIYQPPFFSTACSGFSSQQPLPTASTLHAIAAETELEGVRHEVEAAQGQAQYLNQQWADIHADLLEERDRHEVCTPITSCPHPSLHNALLM